MKRTLLLLVVALPAFAAGGWPLWSPTFAEHPCQDGWVACAGATGPIGPGTWRDTAGRPLPSDLRVGWFDLTPTPTFSPFSRLSPYREPSAGAEQILADASPAQVDATPPPTEAAPIEAAPVQPPVVTGTNLPPQPALTNPGNPRVPVVASAERTPPPTVVTPTTSPVAPTTSPVAPTVTGTGRAPPTTIQVVSSAPTTPPTSTGATRPPETTVAATTMRTTTQPTTPAQNNVIATSPVVTAPVATAVLEPARVLPTTCTDLVALESVALMGQLSAGQRQCLEGRIGTESVQTAKDKVSRVLIADAGARGDNGEWERLVRRHLEDINRSDPDLCYKYALQISRGGVGRASGVIRWADYAMENKQKWNGATYTSRVNALLKLRAEASAKLWQAAEQEYTTGSHTDENEAKAAKLRGQAKDYAKEWLDYARASSQDTKTALALCVSAAGNRQFCEGG